MKFEGLHTATVSKAATAVMGTMFVGLLLLLGLWLYESWSSAQQRTQDQAVAASKIVATNAKWIDALAWQALQRIDESLGSDVRVGDKSKVRDINEAVENLPGQVEAYVVDRDGTTLLSTDPTVKPVPITDRPYFAELKKGARQHVSSLLVSRQNGQQIFVFSRRIERNGAFAGAAMVSFEVDIFADILESADLGPDSTVGIIRRDGQLVARFPLASGPLDMSGYVLFTDYLPKSPTGTYFAVSPADGVARTVGYRSVEGTDFIAVSAAGYQAGMRSFWNDLLIAVAVLCLAAIGLIAAASWIKHLLSRDIARSTALSVALEENQLLLREIHHRVKNNLQSVQSLIRMQQLPSETQRSLFDRIAAMIAVHEQIYSRDQYAKVSAKHLLTAVVDMLVKSYGASVEVEYAIEDIDVSADTATPLALLANEVVTNSLKYAFPNAKGGKIQVTLKALSKRRACLVISDDGVGFDQENIHSGMGSRLIKGVVSQLQGEFIYQKNGGTTFTAEMNIIEAADPA
ncbi:sensor histidine kinase [Pararhizobium sp. PWRC1-1]|uniref:sensor histidine kinase n=1 Tax=Pararhizobium sp. PWRC1-1 TaxID=2804566 RepID=UPI003CF2D77B